MGLADEIIDKTRQDESEAKEQRYDDVGLLIPEVENNDYIVARIICRNKRKLFKANGVVYYNRAPMSNKIKDNLVMLNGKTDSLIRGDNCILIWERLKELLPEYNRDCIKIADGFIWNRKTTNIEYEKFN